MKVCKLRFEHTGQSDHTLNVTCVAKKHGLLFMDVTEMYRGVPPIK